MNLLFANDRRGAYPESWYAATADPLPPFPAVRGAVRADVCIVGGGYTGLSAALHLAERDFDVVLLEAHRVGFGASGRNGGQVGSGQRVDQGTLEKLVGRDDARKLWDIGEEAKALVRGLIDRRGIDAGWRSGIVHACWRKDEVPDAHAYAERLARDYGYDQVESLDRDALRAIVPSHAYQGGEIDHGAGHLHPLRFAFGLARAAVAAGARLFEGSLAVKIEGGNAVRVATDAGAVVTADHLILACNGYLGQLMPQVAARVMPINNFIVATEPLGDRAAEVLTRDVAVADSKFVVNYFRLSDDRRLLFGGGESYGYRFPADIAAVVRKPMLQVYPHLKDVRIDYAWGGTLAITMNRLPAFLRPASNILSASGYSGHGVAMATMAGRILAEAVAGQAEKFDLLARLPIRRFLGGAGLRNPLLVLAMSWYAMRDRLGI
jgi:gamma-glutamylputrescine oxidase